MTHDVDCTSVSGRWRSLARVEKRMRDEPNQSFADADGRMITLGMLVCSLLKDGSVLDVGCGIGLFSTLAGLTGHPVTGIDAAATAVETTRRRAAFWDVSVDVHRLEAQQVATLGQRFDNVLMVDLLEHIEADETILSRVCEVTALGGRAIVVVPAFQWLYGPHDARGDYRSRHVRRYNRRDLMEKLEPLFRVRYVRYWNALGFPVRIVENLAGSNFADGVIRSVDGGPATMARAAVSWWLRKVENRVAFPLGLSLICVVEKR